jgi:hypothetical protein
MIKVPLTLLEVKESDRREAVPGLTHKLICMVDTLDFSKFIWRSSKNAAPNFAALSQQFRKDVL